MEVVRDLPGSARLARRGWSHDRGHQDSADRGQCRRCAQGSRPAGHDFGFELTHVERLSEATAKLGNGGFDAVLLDLMLPDSSGLATVSSVHDRAPDLPIIVYSGFGAEDVLFAREARRGGAGRGGAQDFLPKSMTTPAVMRRAIVTSIERKRLERYRVLPHLAHFDPLTDLPNRAQLRDDVDHMASQARQTGQSAALLCIDLDRFREFNDTLGPAVGDLLLKACALRLRGCLAEHDGLARTSGDEFAVVQGFQAQPEAAIQLGRNILAAFAQPFELDGRELIASASIGIAAIEGDRSSDQVLECAGIALHRAKEKGRATFCLFELGMEVELRRRRALEWDLKQGLEDNAFRLMYQPQIDARTREITGLTALARWSHPQRGLLEAKRLHRGCR